ncbi:MULTISPECIES: twin-arginine translocase subunit TatC [Prochlorococcus]|uniref:Sec-independent protein translocase protein TatC n=1 Tax=Prochlorococcus marinus (strain SARG / CCMP1375 / SS120) TaxID=167539 RepID=Q7VDB9_PROMA|nr:MULTISPECIES: twin-arginine translocase subunit TatC [Prochlorococcus]AAP99507.1 Sec-independent protein secretion pathway component TatC [Prochlorococcus marinus subsp. marinus str. CCMP1375]KGG11219.1 Twin-arginine translocation protein TatC [Prochlorococcus marinus str. LG]KGG21557.1 Twin-arginine translocation protein TatC [Prochlorococcus marinus str. SS2]KGG23100.1 Twin-arginine translocation protein TatC [Prochlorococcus marinus str. SS35]KGG33809.1 Twin-arginine translocation protei
MSKEPSQDKQMPFFDHLEELRQRLLKSFFAIVLGAVLSLLLVKPLVKILEAPAGSIHFLQLAPGEFLFVSIKVAGYAGLIIALPYIVFQILSFVLPGLNENEKRLIAPAVAGSGILFIFGIFFAWWALVPAALKFLISYGADVVEPLWSIEKYLDFVLLLMVGTGLSFQIPILQFLLGLFGLVQWKQMLSAWRWVLMGSAIAGAVITPSTDPITMLLLATSILFLFLLGILLVAITDQFKEQIPPTVHPP